ncbi:hypothetical protein DMI69_03455 [Escherichia coli]|nr:hypothetical protein [Escherichia coli]
MRNNGGSYERTVLRPRTPQAQNSRPAKSGGRADFTGREQLSAPFRYDIEFTSTDKAIAPESVLMQDGAFSLSARPYRECR